MKKNLVKLLSIMIVTVFLLTGCDSSDYKKAMELFEAGSYAEACEIFTGLGEYEDSAAMVLRCRYEMAVDVYESGDYVQAVVLFTELGNYEDCADLILECQYRMSVELFDSGEYEQAISAFSELGNYADCADRIRQCHYQLGLEAMEEKDYRQARACFLAADGWENSEALRTELAGKSLVQYLEENGKVVYRNTEPPYTVILSLDEFGNIQMDYVFDVTNATSAMTQDVTIVLTLGETETAVVGTSTTSINFMGKKAYNEEFAAGVLNIRNYRYGDEMTWSEYFFEGYDVNGKPTDYRKTGSLYIASNASLERTFQTVEAMLYDSGLEITLADLGFDALG